MDEHGFLFLNPIALAGYAVLCAGALYFTWRYWQSVDETLRRAGRLGLVFVTTLFAMAFTAVALDAALFFIAFYVLRALPIADGNGQLGLGMVLIIAGPVLFLLVGAVCSWLVGARVSRAFRGKIIR
jgi:hypothetical protein